MWEFEGGGQDGIEMGFILDATPNANNDAFSVNEDATLTGSLYANNGAGTDSDPQGDALTITQINGTAVTVGAPITLPHGTLTITNATTGSFTFVPDANYIGGETFSYTISDANGGTDTATASISILPVNDPPAGFDDAIPVIEDTPVTVNVLGNDTDPESDPLTITSAAIDWNGDGNPDPLTLGTPTAIVTTTGAAIGTITVAPNGDVTFAPAQDYTGPVPSLTYTPNDGTANGTTATVTFGPITPVNDPPVFADPDPTSATPFIDPADPATLHVPAIDNVPVAVPLDLYFADPNGDPLIYTPDMTAVPSWVSFDPATNTLTGTPPGDNAGPVSIPVLASDGQGGTYAATIVIEPVNPVPDAVAATTTTNYATPVVVELLANDTDPDGDPLTVTSAALLDPTTGTLSQDPATKVITFAPAPGFSGEALITYTIQDQDGATDTATHIVTVENAPPVLADPDPTPGTPFIDPGDPGTLHVPATDNVTVAVPLDFYFADPNGDPLSYTPDMTGVPSWLNFDPTTNTLTGTPPVDNAGPLSIPVVASDGNGGVYAVTIVIEPGNPAPDAVDGTATTAYATPIVVDLLANDTDPDGDPLTVVGTPTVDPAQGAMSQDLVTGAWTFTPATGFAGNAVITYTVEDQDGLTDTAIHTVTVLSPPKPIAVNDVYTTSYGVALNGSAGSNDTVLPGSVFTALSQPLSGTLAFNPDGTYTYAPQTGFVGTDSFAYEIEDATGQKAMAFEVIRVTPPPIVAVSDSSTTPFETTLNGAVGANDTYAPGSLFIAITAPSHGTLSLNADGTYVYTPAPGFTGTDMFAYAVTDPTGQTQFATNTIAVVPPSAPVAVDDTYATSYATPMTGNAATGDTLHAVSTFAATSQPTHGTLVFNPDGTFTYAPSTGFAGTDTFTYKITDILGQTSTATEIINVMASAIAAVDDSYTTGYATPVVGNAATGDTYAPGSIFTLASAPAHGVATMNPDGTYTYTPEPGFAGTDAFVYAITDPTGQIVAATQTITVTAPVLVAVDDVFTNVYGLPIAGNASAGDSFPPGSVFTATTIPTNGTVAMNPDGTYTYTPAVGFAGTDTFDYAVTDPTGQVVIATQTIVITPPPLIAVGDTLTSAFNTSVNGDVASGDTFVTGSVFSVATPPAQGTLAMNPDGTFHYTPPGNFAGTVTFTYLVTDPTGQTATAIETIVVGRPQLIATDDAYATPYNTPLNGNAAVGDTAVAGSIYRAVTTPTYGSLTMNANGTYQYIPQADFVGVDTFTYSITDPTGQVVTAVEFDNGQCQGVSPPLSDHVRAAQHPSVRVLIGTCVDVCVY